MAKTHQIPEDRQISYKILKYRRDVKQMVFSATIPKSDSTFPHNDSIKHTSTDTVTISQNQVRCETKTFSATIYSIRLNLPSQILHQRNMDKQML